MTDLRKAAEQNITYCVYPKCLTIGGSNGPCSKPLYKVSPKREWVGLTDEEMRRLKQKSVDDGMTRVVSDFEYIRSIEAKLKEKNT